MRGISVIIPTLNRARYLDNTLKCLEFQDFRGDWEIIIVDQSGKGFDCKNNPKINYYNTSHLFKGLPEARNYGAQKARYDLLIFIDDDVEFGADFIRRHFESYQENICAVAGRIKEINRRDTGTKTGYLNKWTLNTERGFHLCQKKIVDHFPGGNFSIPKDIYLKLGGTDENMNVGASLYEETELAMRLKKTGAIIIFNPAATLNHLGAEAGGCRINDIKDYVDAMVHNRAVIINRHLLWYQKPVALLQTMKLALAFFFHYHQKDILKDFIKSYNEGKRKGRKFSKFTIYQNNS